jgi:DNA primase
LISSKSIDEVISTVNAVEVVEDYVQLKKRGSNYIGLCPFHDEKTPSFAVSPTKNIFKCFGCGRGGNAVQFIMEHEQMSFPEAIRLLAEKYGIELEETERTSEEQEAAQERESLYVLNRFAADFYRSQLTIHPTGKSVAVPYLQERGFLEKTLNTFEVGFAPASGTALYEHAIKSGYKEEQLNKAALLNTKGTDFFRNRIIFPIHKDNGKIIAFAGRIMRPDPKAPKYINSRETEIYIKGTQLYGLFQAKKSIRKEDKCFLVEGYTDVMSLHQAGVENVVATSGTALTARQVKLLKRFTNEITLLYDGDPAGIAAAERGLEIMLEQDVNVRICVLPEGDDPDSFIKEKGISGFKQYTDKEEKDFILFKADRLSASAANDPIKKADMIRDMVSSIARVKDTIKRSIYIQQCSQLFDISENLLITELNSAIKKQLWQKRKEEQREEARQEQIQHNASLDPAHFPDKREIASFQEMDIVRIIIRSGHRKMDQENDIHLSEYILENIKDVRDDFEDARYQKVIDLTLEALEEGNIPDTDFYLHHSDEEIQKLAIELSTSPYEFSENWEKRWDIRLQTQKMPEDNFEQEAYRSLMEFKLKQIGKLFRENQEIIDKFSKEEERKDELERHLHIHQELMEERARIALELRRVIV